MRSVKFNIALWVSFFILTTTESKICEKLFLLGVKFGCRVLLLSRELVVLLWSLSEADTECIYSEQIICDCDALTLACCNFV